MIDENDNPAAGASLPTPMTGGELKRWRFEMHLNQSQAARALGVAHRTITAYEIGETPIPLMVAYACRWLAQQAGRDDRPLQAQIDELREELSRLSRMRD